MIPDFRVHKMENGGLTAVGVFRKHISANAQHSKYSAIIKSREEVDAEEAQAELDKKLKVAKLAEQAKADASARKQ